MTAEHLIKAIRVGIILCFAGHAAAGFGSSSSASQDSAPFNPVLTKTFADFGAVGDGRADDTAAIRKALAKSDEYCLDGQNRSYKVVGTLTVTKSLCLKRTTLLQAMAPFDTRPYITQDCPAAGNPFVVTDCRDSVIPEGELVKLREWLVLRTLLIRPSRSTERIRVNLDQVTINRGHYPEAGSRNDSAGIWLEGARHVNFNNVEITGAGKGYGLLLIRSENVTLTNLNIHDIVWAPYNGDTPLKFAKVEAIGWNAVPIHEFRARGEDAVRQSKFYGVRIQEQVTCAFIAESKNVVIRNAKISKCLARFDTGDLPWQTDGLNIGSSSSDIIITGETTIDSTWEGVDIVAGGSGVRGLRLDGISISNSFSFGLKLGYSLTDVTVSNPRIRGAGLAGMVMHGPVKKVTITGAKIFDVGMVTLGKANMQPWPQNTRAGIHLDKGSRGTSGEGLAPDQVIITDAMVESSSKPNAYDFGFLNSGGGNARVINSSASGYRRAFAQGFR